MRRTFQSLFVLVAVGASLAITPQLVLAQNSTTKAPQATTAASRRAAPTFEVAELSLTELQAAMTKAKRPRLQSLTRTSPASPHTITPGRASTRSSV